MIIPYFYNFTAAASKKVKGYQADATRTSASPRRRSPSGSDRAAGPRPRRPAHPAETIARFLLKRLGLALITLFLLSVIVFAAAQLLPGDLGRNVLGPSRPAGRRRSSTTSPGSTGR